MEVFDKSTSRNTGALPIPSSWMLISPRNSSSRNLSMQISQIPAGSEQPVHSHDPEQCYYIIRGTGLMMLEGETREVSAGSAVYIPPNKRHGIKNTGAGILEYVTVNSPPFDQQYENTLWPAE